MRGEETVESGIITRLVYKSHCGLMHLIICTTMKLPDIVDETWNTLLTGLNMTFRKNTCRCSSRKRKHLGSSDGPQASALTFNVQVQQGSTFNPVRLLFATEVSACASGLPPSSTWHYRGLLEQFFVHSTVIRSTSMSARSMSETTSCTTFWLTKIHCRGASNTLNRANNALSSSEDSIIIRLGMNTLSRDFGVA